MAQNRKKVKTLTGTVISDKMQKTIVVRITTKKPHPKYTKLVRYSVKFKVHDEHGKAKTGDTVKIVETRPLSKEKRWRLFQVLSGSGKKET